MEDNMVKIYADGADINDMRTLYVTGKIKGFTTNPTLMRVAGVENYKEFAKQAISEFPGLPISFEVFADTEQEMVNQAMIINSWGENVYVKIPVTYTNGEYTTNIIRLLSGEGIKLNITAILTQYQILRVKEAINPKIPAIVSIFAGRIADTGVDPTFTMKMAAEEFSDYENTEVLWASCREVYNVIQAEQCGCDIITVPVSILSKLNMVGADLTELSLDTVRMFYNDAQAAGYAI
jgi:transaldolase